MLRTDGIFIETDIYDIEICVGVEELKRTIRVINDCSWKIISMTQFEEVYTVLFRRPKE